MQNQTKFRNVTKCRLCDSTNLRVALGLRATPLGDRYLKPGMGAGKANLVPLDILQCAICGNYETSSVIDATGIYESYLSRPGAVNTVLTAAYQEYAKSLISIAKLAESDLVVELGSNDGLFASFFAKRGFKCVGIDPAKNLPDNSVPKNALSASGEPKAASIIPSLAALPAEFIAPKPNRAPNPTAAPAKWVGRVPTAPNA